MASLTRNGKKLLSHYCILIHEYIFTQASYMIMHAYIR